MVIKGHSTKGNEVIVVLKMLGGRNPHNYSAVCGSLCFYIGKENNIIYYDWVDCCEDEDILVFTLEEFLEKFPYKVGDKVMTDDGDKVDIVGMVWDNDINDVFYEAQICNEVIKYTKELLQPYKEENMDEREEKAVNHVFDVEVISFDIAQKDKYELDLQGKFEVVLREGKYYVERIKPKYPNTYEECCKILQVTHTEWHGYLGEVLVPFQKLLICRNAYWKIAGGWKPDWNHYTEKYVIYPFQYLYSIDEEHYRNTILAFPTEEMRDAFYENFKELIEECKEFL